MMSSKSFVVAALLSAFALAGCSGTPRKPVALPDLGTSNSLKSSWQAGVGKAGDYFFQPAVGDNRVVVASHDGTIVVLEEASGKSMARFSDKDRLAAGVGASGDSIAVVTVKGELVVFDALGKQKWRASIGGEVLAAPAVNSDLVVVRTTDGRVIAFKAADGKRAWLYSRPLPALTLRNDAGILLTRAELVMGVPGGRVIVLDLEAGRLLAEFTIANPKGASELERVADVSGTPVLEDKRLCAVSFQGRVGCIDASNGATIWAKEASSAVGLGVDEKNIYVAGEDGTVQAFAKDGGASVWKNSQLINRLLSNPVPTSAGVLVGDNMGNVLMLSKETGAILGRASTDGSQVHAIAPISGGAVVSTSGGSVVGFIR